VHAGEVGWGVGQLGQALNSWLRGVGTRHSRSHSSWSLRLALQVSTHVAQQALHAQMAEGMEMTFAALHLPPPPPCQARALGLARRRTPGGICRWASACRTRSSRWVGARAAWLKRAGGREQQVQQQQVQQPAARAYQCGWGRRRPGSERAGGK